MRPFRELGFVETTNSQLKRERGERIKGDRKRTEKGGEGKDYIRDEWYADDNLERHGSQT